MNRRPSPRKASLDLEATINDFKEYLIVDLQHSKRTVKQRVFIIKRFLKALDKPLDLITRKDLRRYLLKYKDYSPAAKSNILKAFKLFFRDFLNRPKLVETFKFPPQPFKPKRIPTKEHLRTFYRAFTTPKDRALFLMYATTGLRRNEVLSLQIDDINLNEKSVIPKKKANQTKHTWISFFNEEAKEALNKYLATRRDTNTKLFPLSRKNAKKIWGETRVKTKLDITPQVLREWFACEMTRLKVSDRYIDAFCGRVPRSILARHYTDYSPDKLKDIYDMANLIVLS